MSDTLAYRDWPVPYGADPFAPPSAETVEEVGRALRTPGSNTPEFLDARLLTLSEPLWTAVREMAERSNDPETVRTAAHLVYGALLREAEQQEKLQRRVPIDEGVKAFIHRKRQEDTRFRDHIRPDVHLDLATTAIDVFLLSRAQLLENAKLFDRHLASPPDIAWMEEARQRKGIGFMESYLSHRQHIAYLRNIIAHTQFRIRYLQIYAEDTTHDTLFSLPEYQAASDLLNAIMTQTHLASTIRD